MALDQTFKDKIANALSQLDHSNPEHWVEDGLPRTSVVQQLANDPNIRRTDINEVAPGFARLDPATHPETIEVAAKPIEPIISAVEDEGPALTTTRDEARRHTTMCEQALANAEKEHQVSTANVLKRRQELSAARQDENLRFPRVTHSQMVQDYLKSSNEQRRLEAEGRRAAQNGNMPADYGRGAGQGFGKRMGSTVPYATGPDGLLVRPLSRLDIARARGVPSVGVGAVPQR